MTRSAKTHQACRVGNAEHRRRINKDQVVALAQLAEDLSYRWQRQQVGSGDIGVPEESRSTEPSPSIFTLTVASSSVVAP